MVILSKFSEYFYQIFSFNTSFTSAYLRFYISLDIVKFPNPVRGITNGQQYTQGHVEIYHNGEWGTICYDYFNNNGAKVLCKMMHYATGIYSTSYRQSYVTPSSRIWLDDVRCSGTETHIDRCPRRSWGSHNCDHRRDVALRCYGKYWVSWADLA